MCQSLGISSRNHTVNGLSYLGPIIAPLRENAEAMQIRGLWILEMHWCYPSFI